MKGRKTGGRKAGTPNKLTAPLRQLMSDFCEGTLEDFVNAFNRIDEPKDKCRIWLDAAAYVMPKMSSVTVKDADKQKTMREELEKIALK